MEGRLRELETTFQATNAAIFLVEVVDGDTFRFLRTNPALHRATGLGPEEIDGTTPCESFGEEQGAQIEDNYRRCVRLARPLSYEETLAMPGGRRTWFTKITPVEGDDGEVEFIVGSALDISELRESREKLRETRRELQKKNQLLQSILDNAPMGIWVADETHRPVIVNRYLRKKTGLGTPQKSLRDDELEDCRRSDREVLRGRGPRIYEKRVTFRDGRQHVLQAVKTKFVYQDRTAVLGLAMDVTERKRAEERTGLLVREQRALLDNIDMMIWYLEDPETAGLANRAFREFFGIESGEEETLDLGAIIPAESWEAHRLKNYRAFSGEADVHSAEWISAGFEEERLLSIERTPVMGENGSVDCVVCVAVDITRRRRMETLLRRREQEFKALAENSPDLVTRIDRNFRRLYTNPVVRSVFGISQEEAIGKTNRELEVDASVTAQWETSVREVFESGEAQTAEWLLSSDGEVRYYLTKLVPEFDDSGRVESVLSISRDISNIKEAHLALQASEEKYRALVQQSGEMMFLHDLEGNLQEVNQAACDGTGYTREELLQMNVFDLHADPSRKEEIITLWKNWRVGDPSVIIETQHSYRNREFVPVELSSRKVEFGGRTHILALVRDVTERKRAEDELRYRSFHDSLTGLYNRHFLEEEMRRLNTARQIPISVMMVDLNGLKLVNDTYGHRQGDQILKHAARILSRCCREEDIVGRWGGDEFVISLPQTARGEVESMRQRILQRCSDRFVGDVPISMTVGVATKTDSETPLYHVLTEAENDMYRLKLIESLSQKSALINTLLRTLGEKSHETETHTERMTEVALAIGEAIGLTRSELNKLALVVQLHDIGKVKVPESILLKEGVLTPEEWDMIRAHPETGYRIARSTGEFAHVAEEILSHHERWDGSGYPRGLRGGEIPLLARIVAIADAYEVMTNGRPYRRPIPHHSALKELRAQAGKQFDPDLVDLALEQLS